ncbi:LysR family transcriptional regulator [Nocardia sp. NPDC050406]|uniref:LysR family transcriptional regulator n=1 Tax=Nocardia sp. NPDC050406 TaxID=3364318 RepID=UPI0037A49764
MERYEIETFLALAEELHFARTAERLRLSPARVSQTIKQLERRIGSPLFERSSRQVSLTPLGQRFRDDLLPGYQRIQQALRDAVAAGHGLGGRVRVDYSSAWAGTVLVRAADVFRAEHPRCEIEIRELSLVDSFGLLRAGEVDLQLSEHPVDVAGLTAGAVLFSESPALLVPAGHPLAQRDSATLNDLARAPLLTFAGLSPAFQELHYPRRTSAGETVEHIEMAMTFHEAMCHIAEGKGITVVAARAERFHTREDLAFVPLLDAPPFEYGLLWPTARANAVVEAFARTVCRVAHDAQAAR